jgi:hypothetical protein
VLVAARGRTAGAQASVELWFVFGTEESGIGLAPGAAASLTIRG